MTFAWHDGEDDVLLVGFGPDFAVATVLRDGTFFDLEASDDEDVAEVEIGGQWSEHPKRFLMTRSAGSEVLMQAPDADGLFARHKWVSPGDSE